VPSILLPIPHHLQRSAGDCLAACAAMALQHLELSVDYDHLLELLEVKPYGTAGYNLKNLAVLGVQVIYTEGTLGEVKAYLADGFPCIALVRTSQLHYWTFSTNHALLVVGFDDQTVYVNDPAFEQAPQRITLDEFHLAWLEFDYRYGVIKL
jgi:ABC-type bacteriocin/lantibiotic exporter with double-glycine peptidase domain